MDVVTKVRPISLDVLVCTPSGSEKFTLMFKTNTKQLISQREKIKILLLHESGMSIKSILTATQRSSSTIRNIIKNETLKGNDELVQEIRKEINLSTPSVPKLKIRITK